MNKVKPHSLLKIQTKKNFNLCVLSIQSPYICKKISKMTPITYQNISLKPYNTFGIDVKARYLCLYEKPSDLQHFITKGPLLRDVEMIILGGGSNQLFTRDFEGVIIHPVNKNIKVISEDADYVCVKADAGVTWDNLVAYAVENNWGGIENLSDIPGDVGASAVQNIGAYGVEAKDCILEVNLVSFADASTRTLLNAECQFDYRSSIFKNKFRNRYLIDSVTFKLTKKHKFITHYGSVSEELKKFDALNLKNIRQAIINIRSSKLPNPKEIGNGGSFFKNPLVSEYLLEKLRNDYPEIPSYPATNDMVKLAAGWLIEQCGLKGYMNPKQTAGIHDKQALVIVNKGNASGMEIVDVARLVQNKVYEKFDVCLEPEVIIN